ncbi:MAG: hypothetical protein M3342_16870 [Bacteroidota bacterium]|nr:hypothetical protein [Bacteroidota bacterium]
MEEIIALLTLILLEVVLGIDNIIFFHSHSTIAHTLTKEGQADWTIVSHAHAPAALFLLRY